MFLGLPPCLPILLYEVPLVDNDRDDVADAPVVIPTGWLTAVVGVIDTKLSGGACIWRGRDRGKDRGVEDGGLNPL